MLSTWMLSSGDCSTGIRWVIWGLALDREAMSIVKPASRNPSGCTSGAFRPFDSQIPLRTNRMIPRVIDAMNGIMGREIRL